MSIGALSHATGVPVETLRTWERRYGFPSPTHRADSKHRRYSIETLERLREVLPALELGHKPSLVLGVSGATLEKLLALGNPGARADQVASRTIKEGNFIGRCLAHARALEGEALLEEFVGGWNEVGAISFLSNSLDPFLTALGEAWRCGDIEVGHEHFVSEHVRQFLCGHWRPLSSRGTGPHVVCAALAGEHHVLGLHMAATVLALGGARITFLGADTPVAEVVRVAVARKARAVALSSALGADRHVLERAIKTMLRTFDDNVKIVVGGRGVDTLPKGVDWCRGLAELMSWTRDLLGHHRVIRRPEVE